MVEGRQAVAAVCRQTGHSPEEAGRNLSFNALPVNRSDLRRPGVEFSRSSQSGKRMYAWVKAFHVIFMVTWFAGLFYLPRLVARFATDTNQRGHVFCRWLNEAPVLVLVGAVLPTVVLCIGGHDPSSVRLCTLPGPR